MIFKKNKKGVEGGGFSIVAGLVILVISAIVIVMVIQHSAKNADEKVQVDLCRVSNEIKIGAERRSRDWVSTPRVCNTIDKTTKKSQVPTENYDQNKKGAESEIRDMIKNCWYMWLEGSKSNTFEKYPHTEGCFVCYLFKIKDEDEFEGVNLIGVEASMSEPYFASDSSNGCVTNAGGFFQEDDCSAPINGIEGWKIVPSKKALAQSSSTKCCISQKIPNECENRGGMCLDDGETSSIFTKDYGNKWSCPKSTQSCFVNKDYMFSYTKYITEFGKLGGDVYFIPPSGQDVGDIGYVRDEIYAISFASPSEQRCDKDPENSPDAKCYAKIGVSYVIGGASGIPEFIAWGIKAYGKIGGFFKRTSVDALTTLDYTTTKVPNLIIVSSSEHADEIGCKIE
jgi:hypothetical protein